LRVEISSPSKLITTPILFILYLILACTTRTSAVPNSEIKAVTLKMREVAGCEPTGELDSKTGLVVLTLLREPIVLEQTAIIIVTHDPKVYENVPIQYQISGSQLVNMAEVDS
jgi:hypothetical protein